MLDFTTTIATIRTIAAPAKGAAGIARISHDPADDFAGASYSYVCTCGKGGHIHTTEQDARRAATTHTCTGAKRGTYATLAN